MKKNIIQTLLVSTLAFTSIGCAFIPYKVNPQAPKAYVQNMISVPYIETTSITITLQDDTKRAKLFDIGNYSSRPQGLIAIEANKSLKFFYYEAVPSKGTCTVSVEATLEPNKQYAFVGGASSQTGLIPFIKTRSCQFGIKDLATGKLVSRQE